MPNTDSKPTFDNEQKQTPQTSQYVSQYHRQIEDDTIDLYGLWIILWDKKWLVIALTVISALGSAVYALLQPEIYIAEALLLPPKAKDVQSLNQLQEIEGLQQVLDSNFVFSAFKYNLSSRSLQKKFIEKQGLMDILAPNRTPETRDIEILQRFSEMIKTEKQKIY